MVVLLSVSSAALGNVDSAGPSLRMWELSRQAQNPEVAALFDGGTVGLYAKLASSESAAVNDFTASLDAFLADWDFRGAAEHYRLQGQERFNIFGVELASKEAALGGDALYDGDTKVGFVTCGMYSRLTERSMGMSADWPLAVQLGATYVRVGSAIFGARAAKRS